MFATVDKIPSEHQIPEMQKQNLRKVFTSLKSHATAVASFTLQWQDLEDHFLLVHNAIQSNLRQLQSPIIESQQTTETALPLQSGKHLLLFLISRPRESMRDVVCNSLQENSQKSGDIVIQAMRFFYDYSELECGPGAVRKSCVYLLEQFARAKCKVGEELKEEARRIAVDWKGKLRAGVQFSLETVAFFLLLIAFGLSNEFEADELLEYCDNVICRSDVTELFQELGLSDKAVDFIHRLIAHDKRVEAIRFIYAFELVDKFPLRSLLEAHLDYVQKTARKMCTKRKRSHKAELEAINFEKSALRAIHRITEKYDLASLLPTDFTRKRIKHLIRQKRKIKNLIESDPFSKDQPQPEIRKKQGVPHPKAQPSNRGESKHPQTALPAAAAADANDADAATSSRQHADLYSHQGLEFLTSSAKIPSRSPASQYAYSTNSSSIYSMQQKSSLPPPQYAYGTNSSSIYLMQQQFSLPPTSQYAYGAHTSSTYLMQRQSSPPPPPQYAYGANSSSTYLMQQQSYYRSVGLLTTHSVEHFRPHAGGVPLRATSPHYLMQRSQYDQEHPYIGNGTHQLSSEPTHYSLASSSGGLLTTHSVEHFRPHAGGVPLCATSPHYLMQRSQYDQERPYVGNGTHQSTSEPTHYSLASSSGDALQASYPHG